MVKEEKDYSHSQQFKLNNCQPLGQEKGQTYPISTATKANVLMKTEDIHVYLVCVNVIDWKMCTVTSSDRIYTFLLWL